MSDDRFAYRTDPDPADLAEADPHRIRMVAALTLVLTQRGWVVEEDPVAVLDRDDELVCTEEGHIVSPADRHSCDLEKERGRGMPMPSAHEVAAAFSRAAERGWVPGRARSN